MNTNSKHYEELNIQPWEIMERNFTTEEFVAYLKGNIIKYTLRDKGQALTDAEKIKHYAEKLIEVLEKKDTNEFLEEDAERIYSKHKFKVGDRVRLILENMSGTIIRTPVKGEKSTPKECYIVELDDKNRGWKATKERHLVESENAWHVDDTAIELLQEKPKTTLEPNKWYDAEDYTVEELKELLPVGTKVTVVKYNDNDHIVYPERERTIHTKVTNVGRRIITKETRIGVHAERIWKRYFKIAGE